MALVFNVVGYVQNATTGLPVAGATVTVFPHADANPTVGSLGTTTTDANGKFSIASITDQQIDVQVTNGSQIYWWKGAQQMSFGKMVVNNIDVLSAPGLLLPNTVPVSGALADATTIVSLMFVDGGNNLELRIPAAGRAALITEHTGVTNIWQVDETGAVTQSAGLTATTGNIVATAGNITATAGFLKQGITTSGGLGGVPVKMYDNILGAPAASVTIPTFSTVYSHLLIDVTGTVSDATTNSDITMQVGSAGVLDTGANYDYMKIVTQFTPITTTGGFSNGQTSAIVGNLPGSTSTAGFSGHLSIWIPNYSDTTFFKLARCSGEAFYLEVNLNQAIFDTRVMWKNSTAINIIKLIDSSGGNFVTGTHITMWGYP